jgi:hypothetical protein
LFKRFLKVLMYVFILPMLLFVISVLLNIPQFLKSIITIVVVIYMYIGLLAILFNIQINSKKFKRKKSIYDWMDELPDYDERLINLLKNQDNKFNTIDNLKFIKDLIYKQTNSNLEKLKLYRTYYQQLIKENSDDIYLKSALSFFIPFSLYLFKDNQLGISEANINSKYLSVFLVFITIAFIANKLIVNQKRYGLTLGILDLCVEEIENKDRTDDIYMN